MKISILRLLCAVWFSAPLALPTAVYAADAAPKDGQAILNGVRLKKWTKDLELSAEQQKKISALLEEENKEIGKLNTDANLPPAERASKVTSLREVTYGKMKPLLNETQLQKFEKMLPKPKAKKKDAEAK